MYETYACSGIFLCGSDSIHSLLMMVSYVLSGKMDLSDWNWHNMLDMSEKLAECKH